MKEEFYGTVYEYLTGECKGGRFISSYDGEEIGSVSDNGVYKVIAHVKSNEEGVAICNETDFNKGLYYAINNYFGV